MRISKYICIRYAYFSSFQTFVFAHYAHKPKHISECKKNPNGQLYSKSIHKYFLSIRILGRRTASAEATSVPLSSLSVLPSPLVGWIVRDKGEHHSDNYHGSCPSKFTMSTLYTLSLYCRVQVLEEWFMNTALINISTNFGQVWKRRVLWLVLQVPIQQGRHPRPRVWGHRYQRGVTGIINFLATLSALFV